MINDRLVVLLKPKYDTIADLETPDSLATSLKKVL